jgi:hypothetical protein
VIAQAAIHFGSGFPPKDVNVCPYPDGKSSFWFLTVAHSETTSCHKGTGVEHRSIVETRGKLFLVYVTFRD